MSEDAGRVERFQSARRDRSRVVLEGLHPLKHALRFGADVLEAVATDPERAASLARGLAPDIADPLAGLLRGVPEEVFEQLSPRPPRERVMALARRPAVDATAVLGAPGTAPVVLLERPTHLGNLGAVVRVAAAAGAAAVLTTGRHDPWHPAAVRGSAGLHWALAVAALEFPDDDGWATGAGAGASVVRHPLLRAGERPLVAVDPEGETLHPGLLPPRAILAFGSERRGLSPALLEAADLRVAIPMRAGVSSLNLATAVAVTLYADVRTIGR